MSINESNFIINVVNNGKTYDLNSNLQVGTAYEEFLKVKPNIETLGNLWYELFNDAIQSYVLNLAKSDSTYSYLSAIVGNIISTCDRYTHIYFQSKDGDRALLILKGVLKDIINQYDYNSNSPATDMIFKAVISLIKA